MPIAILKFNLPEEKSAFYLASKGDIFYSCLWDLDQYLREELKYKDKPTGADGIRNKLHELMQEQGISFDEIE